MFNALPLTTPTPPVSFVWLELAIHGLKAFCWAAVAGVGRVLLKDNIARRRVTLANALSLCFREDETIDHLFMWCECIHGVVQLMDVLLFGMQGIFQESWEGVSLMGRGAISEKGKTKFFFCFVFVLKEWYCLLGKNEVTGFSAVKKVGRWSFWSYKGRNSIYGSN